MKLALAMTAVTIPVAVLACGPNDEATTASESSALGVPPRPTTTTPGLAPSSWPATQANAHTTNTDGMTITWNEPGGNGTTLLERQTYDLAGNPTGTWTEAGRWANVTAGQQTFVDAARGSFGVSHLKVVPGVTPVQPPLVLEPDHQVAYRIVEMPVGASTCVGTVTGACKYTAPFMGYMPKTKAYTVSRAQLRIVTTQATAGANDSSLHVQANLGPTNSTWLDTPRTDEFRPGSDVTFDLSTSGLDGYQDITGIHLSTPDSEGFCVSQVILALDGNTAFSKVFPTCAWVTNGSDIVVPFAEIRSSAAWVNYAPDTFEGSSTLTFIGYHPDELQAYLDGELGSKLRDATTEKAGASARIGDRATLTRKSAARMHVQQHLIGMDIPGPGQLSADVDYDLVIHNFDDTCTNWCVNVENPISHSASGLFSSDFLQEWLAGIVVLLELNLQLDHEFLHTTQLPDGTPGIAFVDPNDKTPNEPQSPFMKDDQGNLISFPSGSLALSQNYKPANF